MHMKLHKGSLKKELLKEKELNIKIKDNVFA